MLFPMVSWCWEGASWETQKVLKTGSCRVQVAFPEAEKCHQEKAMKLEPQPDHSPTWFSLGHSMSHPVPEEGHLQSCKL